MNRSDRYGDGRWKAKGGSLVFLTEMLLSFVISLLLPEGRTSRVEWRRETSAGPYESVGNQLGGKLASAYCVHVGSEFLGGQVRSG